MHDFFSFFSSTKVQSFNLNTQTVITLLGQEKVASYLRQYELSINQPMERGSKDLFLIELKKYCDDLKEKLKIEQRKKRKLEKLQSKGIQKIEEESLREAEKAIKNLIPFVDFRTGKVCFYNTVTKSVDPMDEDVYMALNDISQRRDLLSLCYLGHIEFNPLNTESLYTIQSDGRKTQVMNLCKTPKWLSISPSNSEIKDGLIWRLILNVFPDEDSREYALCWVYHAITSRNQTFLSLVGARGVGKGLFADLVGQMVGRNYFKKVGDAILEDKFNSQFENSRVLFFDEVKVDAEDKINKLKAFANNFINMEAKGQDARTIKNYTSGLMANNSISGMKIGPQERRFSIVSIGEKDLRETMSKNEIETLVKILESDHDQEPHEEIVNFGHWILGEYKHPKYSNSYTYKGKHFWDVCRNGMTDWQKFIVEMCESEFEEIEEISLKDLKSKYKTYQGGSEIDKKYFPQATRITDFLTDYKYMDKCFIGKLVSIKDPKSYKNTQAFKINKEFKKLLEEIRESKDTEAELDL